MLVVVDATAGNIVQRDARRVVRQDTGFRQNNFLDTGRERGQLTANFSETRDKGLRPHPRPPRTLGDSTKA
jgi:hypothetical protein